MTNNGAVSKTITPSASSQTYTIPAGYHNGSGKITVTPFKNEDLFDKILGIAFFTLGYNSSTDGYEYGWNKVGDITASGTFSNARYTITIGPGKYLKYININNSIKDPEIITLTANTKYSSVVYAVFIKISG